MIAAINNIPTAVPRINQRFGESAMDPGPVLEAKKAELSCKLPIDVVTLDGQVDLVIKTDGIGTPTSFRAVDYWKQPATEGDSCEPELGKEYITP